MFHCTLYCMTRRQRTRAGAWACITIDNRQRTQFGPHPRKWDATPGRRGPRRLAAPPAYYDSTMRITVMGVTSRPFCRIQLPARLRERGETPYSTEMADDRGRALHGAASSPL